MQEPAPAATPDRLWPWVMIGAIILMLPALLNGVPFVYYDSAVYVTRPEPVAPILLFLLAPLFNPDLTGSAGLAGVLTRMDLLLAATGETRWIVWSGRSPWYRWLGALAYDHGRLWPLIALQSAATSLTIALVWTRVARLGIGWAWLAGMIGLGVLTPLGLFAGLAMPDILAGVLVLAVAGLMLGWAALTGAERLALATVAFAAMLSHQSHVALGAGMAVMLWAGLLAVRLSERGARTGFLAVLLALLGAVGLNQAHAVLTDLKPQTTMLTRPHLVAHLLDHGPGLRWMDQHCAGSEFVVCDHLDRLPVRWITFLFGGPDPQTRFFVDAAPAHKIAISHQQTSFVARVLRDDPVGVGLFALQAAGRQLVDFDPVGSVVPPVNLPRMGFPLPPDLERATAASILHQRFHVLRTLGHVTGATVAASLVLLVLGAALLWRRALPAVRVRHLALVGAILGAVVLNAVICGVLAGPYDRFQSRVIWLVPLAALMLASAALNRFGATGQTSA